MAPALFDHDGQCLPGRCLPGGQIDGELFVWSCEKDVEENVEWKKKSVLRRNLEQEAGRKS